MRHVVLVHGGWEWREVERLLRLKGRDVSRVTLRASASTRTSSPRP